MRHNLTQSQIASECVVQVIAGTDTTSTTIRTALLHILTTPRIHNTLHTEITSALSSGLLSPSSPITHAQALQLPYLTAIIYESLRFRPPALYGHFKSVPPGGDTIDSVFLPEGTAVGHNLIALMRTESIFGSDVDLFRPERFTGVDKATRTEMERTVELAFGSGRWMCAGKLVAFTQMYKCVFEMVRTFEMEFVDVGRPVVEESAIFWSQGGMWVKIEEGKGEI